MHCHWNTRIGAIGVLIPTATHADTSLFKSEQHGWLLTSCNPPRAELALTSRHAVAGLSILGYSS